jgi:hypothetical protein
MNTHLAEESQFQTVECGISAPWQPLAHVERTREILNPGGGVSFFISKNGMAAIHDVCMRLNCSTISS